MTVDERIGCLKAVRQLLMEAKTSVVPVSGPLSSDLHVLILKVNEELAQALLMRELAKALPMRELAEIPYDQSRSA